MPADALPTAYDPKLTEERWYARWEESGVFRAAVLPRGRPYTIVLPPPNVTGVLHMGHALNTTIQDILIRWRRMQGREALWVPGVDHAGIATQNVVERKLAREGLTRHDLGRERFVAEVWRWKDEHGGIITRQLRRLGASCDWSRERFTMDPGLSRAVREAFVRLYGKGLLYRGKYIINWCPRCRTALADEEVEHQEVQGNLYYVRYRRRGGDGHLTVATTRPETMLGDTAVAVHPEDERYRTWVGQTVLLPLVGRELPVIADAYVDPAFGTGALKVTPAHDPNDFLIGHRHGLPVVMAMNPDGTMSEAAGRFAGMDRFACRAEMVEALRAEGLLEKVVPHAHAVGHCYRCHTMVEPFLSDQWFVRMRPLAEPAIAAVREGRVRFHPDRWTKVYLSWMESIRDWCISRQIWWGHRIPVWYCDACGRTLVAREDPERCDGCGRGDLRPEQDVLDTWFSSWLWPFSTLGWPEETDDLRAFYPTDTLVTDAGIIFFWVARMIMAGCEFMGEIPFRDVHIHGTVKDAEGRRMSKSLGNVIDPLQVIDRFGADALRLSLISIAAQGQDIYLSDERFHLGRNFANKVWNAARLLLLNAGEIGKLPRRPEPQELADRWIRSRWVGTAGGVDEALETFRFNEAAALLYDFFWHDLCDWYLELIKPRLAPGQTAEARANTLALALGLLETTLRLLHPFMPSLTEEIWQRLPHEGETLVRAAWPRVDLSWRDPGSESAMAVLREVAAAVNQIRTDYRIPPGRRIPAHLVSADGDALELLRRWGTYPALLARIEPLAIHREGEYAPGPAAGRAVVRAVEVIVPLEGIVDVARERERVGKELARALETLRAVEATLADASFRERAPREVVEREERKRADINDRVGRLRRALEALG